MDQQAIETIRLSSAANVARSETALIVMVCLLVCLAICMIVVMWRGAQRDKAARRVRDRLFQEEHPEGWARRQAREAREATLIAQELSAMRRASWYRRLLRWGRHTDQAQA
jgi:hypothetical protein